MDAQNAKTWLEIQWLWIRGFLRTGIQLCGLGLVVLGALNFFGPFLGIEPVAMYPRTNPVAITETAAIMLEDVIVMVVGAILAYFV